MELAIDTSTAIASLALATGGKTLAELTWRTELNHTREVLPAIQYLLGCAKASLSSIEAVVIALGPGSFSGLRVGLSIAKGMAITQCIPLVGIGTLAVEALPFASSNLPIRPMLDAGRGEIATALYQLQRGTWRQLEVERLATLDDLANDCPKATLFCGERAYQLESALKDRLKRRAVLPLTKPMRRAGYLAFLGWQRLASGERDDPATLQPIYLRDPAITISARI